MTFSQMVLSFSSADQQERAEKASLLKEMAARRHARIRRRRLLSHIQAKEATDVIFGILAAGGPAHDYAD